MEDERTCCQREEQWRDLEPFPGYQVSNLSRIKRAVGGRGAKAGRILKPFNYGGRKSQHLAVLLPMPADGQLPLGLRPKGNASTTKTHRAFMIARLVAWAWVSDGRPTGVDLPKVVDHKDQDPLHCCDTNLQWLYFRQHLRKHHKKEDQ